MFTQISLSLSNGRNFRNDTVVTHTHRRTHASVMSKMNAWPESFFACYLLRSLHPKHPYSTYIGFTVNPYRRLRQHNGEIANGAKRTKRKRPWKMVALIYGFTTKVAALQFEWACTYHRNRRTSLERIVDGYARRLTIRTIALAASGQHPRKTRSLKSCTIPRGRGHNFQLKILNILVSLRTCLVEIESRRDDFEYTMTTTLLTTMDALLTDEYAAVASFSASHLYTRE